MLWRRRKKKFYNHKWDWQINLFCLTWQFGVRGFYFLKVSFSDSDYWFFDFYVDCYDRSVTIRLFFGLLEATIQFAPFVLHWRSSVTDWMKEKYEEVIQRKEIDSNDRNC